MEGQPERGVRSRARVQRPVRRHVVLLHDAVLPGRAGHAGRPVRRHAAVR